MSWEAVTWATKQRMKSSHEQLVLLVLANAADPDGVAFARWPGRDHWWHYLVDLTRLSKSTLFRDINTLIEVGLCARSMIVMADGTRRPTIQLDLTASYKFEKNEEQNTHSHTGNEDADEADESENDNDISYKQDESGHAEIHSHTETGDIAIPTGGNDPFPIVGMHKDDSKSCSKESPPAPHGGTHDPDDGFEEFCKAWLRPIERLSVAKSEWSRVPSAKRGEAITAARGYFSWIALQPKQPAIVSAQTFIRENAGWAQWLRYVPDGTGIVPLSSTTFARDSLEAKAILALHDIAGLGDFFRRVNRLPDGSVTYRGAVTPRLLALAQATQFSQWLTLDRQQAAAWEGLLRDHVTVPTRTRLREGSKAPWPWPPRKDGTLASTPPPETYMTEEDFAELK